MASNWDQLSAQMDGIVDAGVGDDISYDAGAGPVAIKGFVIPTVEPGGLDAFDDKLGSRPRVKVAKATVPVVSSSHRLTAPLLGSGSFRPANSDPEEQGRYWIFDVQKV